jgi:adenylylsulfate kinase-like enzyme
MIIWFTGQPKSGKTTLARLLSNELKCPWIDGDVVRKLVGNNDYSELGRRENIDLIQEMAVVSHRHNKYCVVSAVAPFRDQRDRFKTEHDVLEVYLPTPPNHKTARHVTYYEPPVQYFLEVNTFLFTPDVCLAKIMDSLTPIHA